MEYDRNCQGIFLQVHCTLSIAYNKYFDESIDQWRPTCLSGSGHASNASKAVQCMHYDCYKAKVINSFNRSADEHTCINILGKFLSVQQSQCG